MKPLAALLALMACTPAMAQAPFPTPERILPPAPVWHGASERLVVAPNDPWITPSERTGLTATPSYDETIAWLKRLDAASPLIRMERFGKTAQGRDLWLVIACKGRRYDADKPTLLAQAGIHAGEIDGKDAGLMLLRDIAVKGKSGLLDGANLLFVPMFNADGHERTSPYNRPNQRGPVSQGWRTTAQNLNLNRDYLKADTPEMRAMIELIRRFDPDLYLDLHVTDGLDHQFDITFDFNGYGGEGARSTAVARWLDGVYRPAIEAGLKRGGHIPGPYINTVDPRDPAKGIIWAPSGARFSTGYGDARRMATVLVETHSLKPYRQRVLGTYVLMEETLRLLGREGRAARAAAAADRRLRPASVPVAFKPSETPKGMFDFLPIGSELYLSPASGRREVRFSGRPGPAIRVPVFGQETTARVSRPAAYWVPATKPEVIERLRLHGVQMEVLAEPRTVELEFIRFSAASPAASVNEGHVAIRAGGPIRERRREVFPAGSVRVETDQPLGEMAMLMLEPESDESLWAWGFFPEILQRTEYIEGYAMAPLAERMLATEPRLKAEFEAALEADPKFAADGDARLAWFYRRTPYFDARYLLYPVGIER